jgi:uncharacterized protein YndB with AHSA1/START domain
MEATPNNGPLVVEKVLNAPIAKVWDALTDLSKIKQWYFDIADFKPEVGFEFQFTGGDGTTEYLHKCIITAVVPDEKLAYTWRYKGYPGISEVGFVLTAEGDWTKVTITHTGLETFPQTGAFNRSNFNAGWNHILGTSLKEFVEKA